MNTGLIVPRKRASDVLRQLHDDTSGGNFVVKRTLERVRERFYCVNRKEDVKEWRRKCTPQVYNKTRTTPLHPQSDGMVVFLMAYRSSVHETTEQAPACLLFSREMRLPCHLKFGSKPGDLARPDYVSDLRRRMDDIHDQMRTNIQSANDRNADKGGYKSGDLVWFYNPQRRRDHFLKLQQHWEGSYEIIKTINYVIYRIRKKPTGKLKVLHFNHTMNSCPCMQLHVRHDSG